MTAPLSWLNDSKAYSPLYNDVYSSSTGALTQARTVFMAGCGLPAPGHDAGVCRVLETGFGLGLNFLVTWAAWQIWREAAGVKDAVPTLHFVSVEAHPVSASDVLRAAAALQAHDDAEAKLLARTQALAKQLAQAWPQLHEGVQTWHFDEGAVQLTLGIGDVLTLLPQLQAALTGSVDAVYLDGFNPAQNPTMWSEPVMQAVAQLCRPGTRLASWCVAGVVKQRLRAAGFEVRKAPGLPPKWHRLEATFAKPVSVQS
jgi:tRNA 5-methylaminomethyl-2-thiouridine biosynthesis bifunctional protein